jgi:hypothetical protein
MTRKDFTAEAEALFREIIAETRLQYEPDTSAPVEVLWRLPIQEKLSVEMLFGLQNADELNLGIGPFWSHIFPFEKGQHDFRRLALGFIHGHCRVAEWRRLGVLCKRVLEEPESHAWRTAYTEYLVPIPLGRPTVTYIVNTSALR